MPQTLTAKKLIIKLLVFLTGLIVVMCVCTLIGSQDVSLQRAFGGTEGNIGRNIDYEILFNIRLPRVILAALVGAALAAAGVVLQAILRNPLADPYILGISSGAGLGVIIAVISGVSWSLWGGSPISLFAFIGAGGTVLLVWLIGAAMTKSQMTSLLLAGVVINVFLSAVIMFLISIVKSDQVYWAIFWLMGNISEKSSSLLWFSAGCILGGIIWLFAISHRLNILTLGEAEAKNLGINTKRTRLLSFVLAAFITAVAVSLSGLIGFVGLIIPHAVRLTSGPDHRQLLPLSALTGAAFLVVADTFARTIIAPAQLPVGVITAIAGGPVFLILLAKYSRKVSWLK